MYDIDNYLMLSGIQHFLFCKRQWALIHIENLWEENIYTSEGEILHQKADKPFIKEKRKNKLISRAMPISSKTLGLSGILDVIEFEKSEDGINIKGKKGKWRATIIEYKRGKKKKYSYDDCQLMAEAICLKEELGINLEYGYIYYGKTDTREKIIFEDRLRKLTIDTAKLMHQYYDKKIIPKAEFYRKCKLCSLYEVCNPRLTKKPKSIHNYLYGEDL